MTSKAAQSIRERAQGVTRSVFTVHILRQTVWDSVAFDVLIADTLGLRLSNMVTDVYYLRTKPGHEYCHCCRCQHLRSRV